MHTVQGTAGRYIAVQGVEEFDDKRHFLFTAGEVNAEEIQRGIVERRALGNVVQCAGTGDRFLGKVEVEMG